MVGKRRYIFSLAWFLAGIGYAQYTIDPAPARYQSSDSLALYHPLQLGNHWIYRTVTKNLMMVDTTYYHKTSVRDTMINLKRFVVIECFSSKALPSSETVFSRLEYERYDSSSSNYYTYNDTEYFADSTKQDSGSFRGFNIVISTLSSPSVPTRGLTASSFGTPASAGGRFWAWGFGLYNQWSWNSWGFTETVDLIYAQINGNVYGTLPTHIEASGDVTLQSMGLSQNYPNPFNSSTRISYTVPKDGHIHLGVYDIAGREVIRLTDEIIPAGRYAATIDLHGFPSGIYVCRMTGNGTSIVRRMVYLK